MTPRTEIQPKTRLIIFLSVIGLWAAFNTFMLFGGNQRVTIGNMVTLFVVIALAIFLALYMYRHAIRNTRQSETGFCGSCGHEIPPGERPEHCQECGAHHRHTTVTYERVAGNKWSALWPMLLLIFVLYTPSFLLTSAGGLFGALGSWGVSPYSYYSTDSLVSSACADQYGDSDAWVELKGRTLDRVQSEALATAVLNYRDQQGDDFRTSASASIWLLHALGSCPFTDATLIRVLGNRLQWNQAALPLLMERELQPEDHAALVSLFIDKVVRDECGIGLSRHELIDWFEAQYAQGTLSPIQIERIRSCAWLPSLELPSVIQANEPFEVELAETYLRDHLRDALSEPRTAVGIAGVSLNDGPFVDVDVLPVYAMYAHRPRPNEAAKARSKPFRIELVLPDPGTHSIAIKYYLFDGQKNRSVPRVEVDDSGEPILPDNATWIIERVIDAEVVVVEGDRE